MEVMGKHLTNLGNRESLSFVDFFEGEMFRMFLRTILEPQPNSPPLPHEPLPPLPGQMGAVPPQSDHMPLRSNATGGPSASRALGILRLLNGWEQLERVDLRVELARPVRTLKAVPFCMGESYKRFLTQSLGHIRDTHAAWPRAPAADLDERLASHSAAWKLFLLLPRMLPHTTRRGGDAGAQNLRRRIATFDRGDCG